MRRLALLTALIALLVGGWAQPAAAHPLGNFTVNTADRLLVGADDVQVLHVVDLAEIPTLQLRTGPDSPDTDRDGRTSDAELTAWAQAECGRVAGQLSLTVDGAPAPLQVAVARGVTVPGQAGLVTQRLECTLRSDRAPQSRVQFRDSTAVGRTGWKEVSAAALCGSITAPPGLPQESPSALLTAYPVDLLTAPLDVTTAEFGVQRGGGCRVDSDLPAPQQLLPRGVDRLTAAYTRFVGQQDLTWPVAVLALLLSVALGTGHAVAPGHGKTVIAAYLVGQRGTPRQAVWLGATVTATHTAGVLLLGAVLSLTTVAAPERLLPATEIASGLLLAGVGVYLLRRALRGRADRHGHAHGHGHGHGHGDEHPHGHEHPHPHPHEHPHGHEHPHEHAHGDGHGLPHEHDDQRQRELVGAGSSRAHQVGPQSARALVHAHGGRAHSHVLPAGQELGWRTLATMGIAGGLVPSPSALVVLLGAAALGRPVFGALLVVGYGLGMAVTLTLAGLLLLRAQARLNQTGWTSGRAARAVRALPALTAAVVLSVGALVVLRGLLTLRGLG